MVELKYKCKCKKEEQSLFVLDREPNEGIEHYMNTIIRPALALHHQNLSPTCRQKELEYLKLYIAPDGTIGGSTTNTN